MSDSPSPPPDRPDSRGLSVIEAARALGTTPDSVRARLRRRTIEGYRDNAGRWRVVLPATVGDGRDGQPTERGVAVDGTATVGDGYVVQLARLEERLAAAMDREQEQRRLVEDLRAERDRLLVVVERLTAERPRRPWPGLRAWWRRVLYGED